MREEFRKRVGREITPEMLIATLKPLYDEISDTQKILGESMMMLCLSKRNNNSLMWSHYTDSSKGFIIGFDSNSSFFKPNTKKGRAVFGLRDVKYSEVREDVVITNSAKDFSNNYEKLFFTKSIDWKYEEELRIFAHPDYADNKIPIGDSEICLFSFPIDCIREVILGCRMDNTLRNKIGKIVETKYPKAKLLNARLSSEKFDYEIVDS